MHIKANLVITTNTSAIWTKEEIYRKVGSNWKPRDSRQEGNIRNPQPPFRGQREKDREIYLFIYWRFIAQSTAQRHLRAFHKSKYCTSSIQKITIQNTLHKHETYSESQSLQYCSCKNGKQFGDAGTIADAGVSIPDKKNC